MASAVSKGRPTLFRTPPALFPSVQRNVSTRTMGRELASGSSDPWSHMLVSKKLRRFIRTRNRSRFRATVPGHLIVLRALPALFGRSLSNFDFLPACLPPPCRSFLRAHLSPHHFDKGHVDQKQQVACYPGGVNRAEYEPARDGADKAQAGKDEFLSPDNFSLIWRAPKIAERICDSDPRPRG